MRKAQTLISGLIMISLLVGWSVKRGPTDEYERTGVLLSELSADESMAFIAEKGVLIPKDQNPEKIKALVKYCIVHAEENPTSRFDMFSFSDTINWGEQIRKAVNTYYGVDGGGYVYVKENEWPDDTEIIYYY